VVDIRPLESKTPNIIFMQQDYMAPLQEKMVNVCDSLSSLSVLEHFGLGRYGDPINYNGHLVGLENMHRTLKIGGKFYLAVPIGLPQRIVFNAHRIFSVKYLLQQFEGKFHVDRFSIVDDGGDLHENLPLTAQAIDNNFGVAIHGGRVCSNRMGYGSGIFEMTKL
jgi:hypothetical protein